MLEIASNFYESAAMNAVPTLLREIPGYPGYLASRDGEIWSEKLGRFVSQHNDRKGYRQVHVYVNGERKLVLVHRLIALAFHPNPLGLPQVEHINQIKDDNRAVIEAQQIPRFGSITSEPASLSSSSQLTQPLVIRTKIQAVSATHFAKSNELSASG